MKSHQTADVCLILEGTYPYVFGGVSSWTQDLIKAQSHLTFHLLCLLPPDDEPKACFDIPKNVLSITNVHLQKLPQGSSFVFKKERKKLFEALSEPMHALLEGTTLDSLDQVINALGDRSHKYGRKTLLDSQESWDSFSTICTTNLSSKVHFWTISGHGVTFLAASSLLCSPKFHPQSAITPSVLVMQV